MVVIPRSIEKCKEFKGLETAVSISGGSDSDIILDMAYKYMTNQHYVFFDTGLEYNATKEHLDYLEERYKITIERCKPKLSIVTATKKHGLPFISKNVSMFIERLQKHNYDFNGCDYERDIKDYVNCESALNWFYNKNPSGSMFNIDYNKGLRDFLINNPPDFNISSKCCQFVKKDVAGEYNKDNDIELSVLGLRRAEHGIRSGVIQSCYNIKPKSVNEFYPIWWFTDADKRDYNTAFNIVNSDCYTKYGLLRTGCAGCPFGRYYKQELRVIDQFEPKLYHAVYNTFKTSYEYTNRYLEMKTLL